MQLVDALFQCGIAMEKPDFYAVKKGNIRGQQIDPDGQKQDALQNRKKKADDAQKNEQPAGYDP